MKSNTKALINYYARLNISSNHVSVGYMVSSRLIIIIKLCCASVAFSTTLNPYGRIVLIS